MRGRDTSDAAMSALAVLADAIFICGGFMTAAWARFDSGLIPMFHDTPPPHLYELYFKGALVATMGFLFVFQTLGLYIRPQFGSFPDRIPRLLRGTLLGFVLAVALAFSIRTEPPFSRIMAFVALPVVFLFVLVEKRLLFQLELHLARHHATTRSVLVLGVGWIAGHIKSVLDREPRLRSRVVGFLRTGQEQPHESVPPDMIMGDVSEAGRWLADNKVSRVILTDTSIGHAQIVKLIMQCEQALVTFQLVPDTFQMLTGGVEMQVIHDIPVIGIKPWPLDRFWNRMIKRASDVVGAALGILLFSLPCLVIVLLIKRSSKGSAFYLQERIGEKGRRFTMFKFRTMLENAEQGTGPVWAQENDPRRTGIGKFLRAWNLDELPQLWNVLKGDMSLVGPRPERPHFVNHFKEDVQGYMSRHLSRPGMTGWAQVNGLRGNTDVRERVKYDLFYLENWSLSFDFKILSKTLFAWKNAY